MHVSQVSSAALAGQLTAFVLLVVHTPAAAQIDQACKVPTLLQLQPFHVFRNVLQASGWLLVDALVLDVGGGKKPYVGLYHPWAYHRPVTHSYTHTHRHARTHTGTYTTTHSCVHPRPHSAIIIRTVCAWLGRAAYMCKYKFI